MDINAINKQHSESRKIQNRILKWDDKESPLAKLSGAQVNVISEIEELNSTKAKSKVNKTENSAMKRLLDGFFPFQTDEVTEISDVKDLKPPFDSIIESTPKFLTLYDQIDELFLDQFDDVYLEFYNQLEDRTKECDALLGEVSAKSPSIILFLL